MANAYQMMNGGGGDKDGGADVDGDQDHGGNAVM